MQTISVPVIRTTYWPKPVPICQFDWTAVDDETYDGTPSQPIGYGRTEQEAVRDLITKLIEG
jgi:hypothetical protein